MITVNLNIHPCAWNNLAVLHNWNITNRSDSQNRGIGRVDNCGELLNTEHTKVTDGEGAPLHLIRLQLLLSGVLRKFTHLGGECSQILLVSVLQNRGQQSIFYGYSHSDIDISMTSNGVLHPGAVDIGMLSESMGTCFDNNIIEADPYIADLIQSGTSCDRLLHIDIDRLIEMRAGVLALAQTAGDRLAHLRDTHIFTLLSFIGIGDPFFRRLVIFNILLYNASVRAASFNLSETDPFLLSYFSCQRRSFDPSILISTSGLNLPATLINIPTGIFGPLFSGWCLLSRLLPFATITSCSVSRSLKQLTDILSLFPYDSHETPKWNGISLRDQNLEYGSRFKFLNFHGCLVCLDLGNDISGTHLVALFDIPFSNDTLFHGSSSS